MSESRRGKKKSLEAIANWLAARKGWSLSLEARRKISQTLKGRKLSAETRKKMSIARQGHPYYPHKVTDEERARLSEAGKQRWKDPEYARRILSAGSQRPNVPERRLWEILGDDWKYIGNGELSVWGKYPDFWDGGMRLIELYGDYWHRNDDPQDRIDLFKEHGYDCLVVWEHEVNESPENVRARVREFVLA